MTPVVLAAGFYDDGIGRFILSPGFGGLAVLVGGALTYAAALRKSGDDRAASSAEARSARERLAQETEVSRAARWRFDLTWIYDRATAERPEARIPDLVTLDLFRGLYLEAHTDQERGTVKHMLDLFRRRDPA